MSSAAISRSSPPTRTRNARRSASNPAPALAGSPGSALRSSLSAQVAHAAQQVVQRIGPAAALAAELELDLLEGVGVEQIAQLVGAGQLAQQVAIERQRRDAPFRRGRIVLVQVLRRRTRS